MNRVIEFLGGRRGREVSPPKKMSDISPIIEPATAEEKIEMERYCTKYFNNPTQDYAQDFFHFTHTMVQLIGGERHEEKSGAVIASSNPLEDQETQTSIVFAVRRSDKDKLVTVRIKTESAEQREELSLSFPHLRDEAYKCVITTHNYTSRKTPPEFHSYITGKEEPSSVDIGEKDMILYELQGFAQRVFDVYKRQEVQPSLFRPFPKPK